MNIIFSYSMETLLSPILVIKNIPEESILETTFLSPMEAQKYLEIQDEHRKKQFYWGRHFLRTTLSQILNIPPNEVPLVIDENGKLHLKDTKIFVSLSHSYQKIAVLIAQTPCGIDIEKIDKKENYEKLFERVFKKSLKADWKDEKSKLIEFYTEWTLREAHFKLSGSKETQRQNVQSHTFQIDDFIASYVYLM